MASSDKANGPHAVQRDNSIAKPSDSGELERIREILVGGVSRNTEERFENMEKRMDRALADLSERVDDVIARLQCVDEQNVGREQLASLLSDTAQQLAGKATTTSVSDKAA